MHYDYSINEMKLFKALDDRRSPDDTKFKTLIEHISPSQVYHHAVEIAFLGNWQGPDIDALRRAVHALNNSKPLRLCTEFDKLIEF